MSKTQNEKDKVIFLSNEQNDRNTKPTAIMFPHDKPSNIVHEDGSIDWDYHWLAKIAKGPCGNQFKAAFSCFYHSKEARKGCDCVDKLSAMNACLEKFPASEATLWDEDELDVQI